MAKVITAFDRPCIPADCVAIRAHTPGMHPNRALSGGRRNGLGARGTFTTDCQAAILLSLGSNLGRREDYLARALNRLDERGAEPVLCSSVYETEPVGVVGQGLFLNLVCQVETRQSPAPLLATCLEVESSLGRSRKIAKGPRNIDIDILFFGQVIVRRRDLQIPHPRYRNRKFVLVPLNEILPRFRDPVTGKRPDELLRLCPDRTRVTRYCSATRHPAPASWKIG